MSESCIFLRVHFRDLTRQGDGEFQSGTSSLSKGVARTKPNDHKKKPNSESTVINVAKVILHLMTMPATNELPTIFRMRFSSVRLITFFLRVLCHQFAFSGPGKPLEPLSYGFPRWLALRLTTVLKCSPSLVISRGRRVEAPVQQ